MREARATGVELRLVDGALKLRGQAAPELRTALREAKAGVVAILSGDACRQCGVPLPSPAPLGTLLVYGDGTAECVGCADREVGRILAAAEQAVASPDALNDPAELMLQPGGLAL
jgi:hypothetical protein